MGTQEQENFYLYPAGSRNMDEEYTYTVTGKAGDAEARIACAELDHGRALFASQALKRWLKER